MIMDKSLKGRIDQTLTRSFHELAQVARLDSELDGTIDTGTWTNHKNIIVGYLSYYPGNDSAERSIDVMIKLTFSESIIEFVADVCWSSGEGVEGIVEHDIPFIAQSDLLSELSKLSEMFNQNALQYLKSLLR